MVAEDDTRLQKLMDICERCWRLGIVLHICFKFLSEVAHYLRLYLVAADVTGMNRGDLVHDA